MVQVRKGILNAESGSARVSDNESIKSLSDGFHDKFLEEMENTKQDEELSLEIASKANLQRLSQICYLPAI